MVDRQFEGSLALAQLKCSGTISVLELMEHGYPSRVLFADLYNMYKSVLPPELVSLPARTFCEAMFQSLNLSAKDFKFGITKVFFRPGKFVEFDRIMRSDSENMLAIVAKVKKWLIRSRWVKSALGALCVIKRKWQGFASKWTALNLSFTFQCVIASSIVTSVCWLRSA